MQKPKLNRVIVFIMTLFFICGCKRCKRGPDIVVVKPVWHEETITPAPKEITGFRAVKEGYYLGEPNGHFISYGMETAIVRGTNYSGSGTLPASSITAFGFDNGSQLLIGTSGEGIYKRNGNTFYDCQYDNLDVPSKVTAFATRTSDGKVFALSSIAGIYRSGDNGDTWKHVYHAGATDHLSGIAIDPSDGAIYVGFQWGILKSIDNGDNWAALAPANFSVTSLYNTADIKIMGSIYALTPTDLFVSTDKGASWSEIHGATDFPSGRHFNAFTLSPRAGGGPGIFIGSISNGAVCQDPGVAGGNWKTYMLSLSSNNRILYVDSYSNNYIYMATKDNVYKGPFN